MRKRVPVVIAVAAVSLGISCSEPEAEHRQPTAPTAPSFAKGGTGGGGGIKVKSISVSPSGASLEVEQQVQLVATSNPPGAATSFTWTSTNTAVATVTTSGLVTAEGAGSATIRASAAGKTGTATVTVASPPPPPPPPGASVLLAAGDIAECTSSGDEATANLLDGLEGTIVTLGDNVYPVGSTTDFANCYDGSWGRHKDRTRPSPGNHEYLTTGASGYFAYFGSIAGDPTQGYYSYNLGAWHVIVLNSNSSCSTISCSATSQQVQWLRADLAANPTACTLAYWHHPRFNSGAQHGNNSAVAPFWDALFDLGADVVLNGHEHVYERFAPQTPGGIADAAGGIRQFTVGTGGADHYSFGTIKPNSEARSGNATGVLRLILKQNGYDWQFMSAAGSTFTDSGSGTCH